MDNQPIELQRPPVLPESPASPFVPPIQPAIVTAPTVNPESRAVADVRQIMPLASEMAHIDLPPVAALETPVDRVDQLGKSHTDYEKIEKTFTDTGNAQELGDT